MWTTSGGRERTKDDIHYKSITNKNFCFVMHITVYCLFLLPLSQCVVFIFALTIYDTSAGCIQDSGLNECLVK